jgi:glucose/arabinose dehydrogenase
MKITNFFKTLSYFISSFLFFSFTLWAYDLQRTPVSLDFPWGMTWLDTEHLLITQKSGEIFLVNTQSYEQTSVTHSIPFVQHGQGGLLDIISEGNQVWLSGSVVKEGEFTTAIYQAMFSDNALVEERPIFIAEPYIDSPYHFGSRLEIVGDYLYASIGERGQGNIAQDPSNAIGSIIRIHKNGDIPKDNPYTSLSKWLPELYQIGVRNPQGMSFDPKTNQVFISNHGPKGGDFIGPVIAGSNYGWKKIGWGGTNYTGSPVGDGNAWEPGFLKPSFIWVPSIGVGGIKFYQGNTFPQWKDSLIVASLKFEYLSVLHRNDQSFTQEEIILKNKIGRVRDIEIDNTGDIFLIADEFQSNLFKLTN